MKMDRQLSWGSLGVMESGSEERFPFLAPREQCLAAWAFGGPQESSGGGEPRPNFSS